MLSLELPPHAACSYLPVAAPVSAQRRELMTIIQTLPATLRQHESIQRLVQSAFRALDEGASFEAIRQRLQAYIAAVASVAIVFMGFCAHLAQQH